MRIELELCGNQHARLRVSKHSRKCILILYVDREFSKPLEVLVCLIAAIQRLQQPNCVKNARLAASVLTGYYDKIAQGVDRKIFYGSKVPDLQPFKPHATAPSASCYLTTTFVPPTHDIAARRVTFGAPGQPLSLCSLREHRITPVSPCRSGSQGATQRQVRRQRPARRGSTWRCRYQPRAPDRAAPK